MDEPLNDQGTPTDEPDEAAPPAPPRPRRVGKGFTPSEVKGMTPEELTAFLGHGPLTLEDLENRRGVPGITEEELREFLTMIYRDRRGPEYVVRM